MITLSKSLKLVFLLAITAIVAVVAPSSARAETSNATPVLIAGDPTPPRPDTVIIVPLTLFPWAS